MDPNKQERPQPVSPLNASTPRQSKGVRTFMFTDMAGCMQLKAELGDQRGLEIIQAHHDLVRELIRLHPEAQEIKTIGDAFFIVFESPSVAVRFALRLQSRLRKLSRELGRPMRDRIGIHSGEVSIEHLPGGGIKDLAGIQVDTCARVQGLCQPGRILMTHVLQASARPALKGQRIEDVGAIQWASHGRFLLKGLDEPIEICEVAELGRVEITRLDDAEKAQRAGSFEDPAIEPVSLSDEHQTQRVHQRARLAILTHWRQAWIGAAMAAAALVLSILLPFGPWLANLSYDLAYWFRPDSRPSEALVIYMDDKSKDELGEPDLLEWKRSLHALLIDRLAAAGARAVVFDLLLLNTNDVSSDPGGMQRLLHSMEKFGRVFVAAKEETEHHAGVIMGTRIMGPPEMIRSRAGWGVVQQPGNDSMIRRHYRLLTDRSQPTLAEVVASAVTGKPPDPPGRTRWVNYYGPPGTIPFDSYVNVIAPGRTLDSTFSNKVVFVGSKYGTGFRGGRGTDESETPYFWSTGAKSPGVEINATVFLNLLRRDWLDRPTPIVEFLLLLGAGVVCGFVLVLFRPAQAIGLAAAMAGIVAVVACWLTWKTHWWFAWTLISFVQIPAATVWAIAVRSGSSGSNLRERTQLDRTKLSRTAASNPEPRPTVDSVTSLETVTQARAEQPLISDYELICLVGQGAYGEVWLVRDITKQFHAAKLVRSTSFHSSRPYDREFEGLQRFAPISRSHPGLINILHVGRNDAARCFYYVMELADDERTGRRIDPSSYAPLSLDKVIRRQAPLDPSRAVELILKLAGALGFMHREGLTHRDVKPANILFVRGEPKLADIGLVTALAGEDSSITMVGTAAYMAPEGPGAPSADLFSLGKVFYELITGCPVRDFPRIPPWAKIENHPVQQLVPVILKVCETNPENRYQSAADLIEVLRSLPMTGNPGHSKPIDNHGPE